MSDEMIIGQCFMIGEYTITRVDIDYYEIKDKYLHTRYMCGGDIESLFSAIIGVYETN